MSVEQDVASFNEDYAAAFAARDFEHLADLYSSDAIAVWQDQPLVRGRDGIIEGIRAITASGPSTLSFQSDQSWESGDLVVDVGAYAVNGEDGPGKYVVVFRREGSSLKLLVDCPLEN